MNNNEDSAREQRELICKSVTDYIDVYHKVLQRKDPGITKDRVALLFLLTAVDEINDNELLKIARDLVIIRQQHVRNQVKEGEQDERRDQ